MPRGFHHCNSWYWLVLSEGAYTCHIIFVIFISCLYNIYICVSIDVIIYQNIYSVYT